MQKPAIRILMKIIKKLGGKETINQNESESEDAPLPSFFFHVKEQEFALTMPLF